MCSNKVVYYGRSHLNAHLRRTLDQAKVVYYQVYCRDLQCRVDTHLSNESGLKRKFKLRNYLTTMLTCDLLSCSQFEAFFATLRFISQTQRYPPDMQLLLSRVSSFWCCRAVPSSGFPLSFSET